MSPHESDGFIGSKIRTDWENVVFDPSLQPFVVLPDVVILANSKKIVLSHTCQNLVATGHKRRRCTFHAGTRGMLDLIPFSIVCTIQYTVKTQVWNF